MEFNDSNTLDKTTLSPDYLESTEKLHSFHKDIIRKRTRMLKAAREQAHIVLEEFLNDGEDISPELL